MPPINTGDRKELGKFLQSLAAGDQMLTTRIDRLARSVFELFAIVKKSSARGTIAQPCGTAAEDIRIRCDG